MFNKFSFLIIWLVFLSFFAVAQQSNERCKWIKVSDEGIDLDSLTVLPSSITIRTTQNDSISGFIYDLNNGGLLINDGSQYDSLLVCYRVLPYRLHKKVYHRNLSVYDSNAFFQDNKSRYSKNLIEDREELFSTEGLSKTGSISRGISFGNRQDVFVNSVLNLQLDGKLTDDINIRAAISDQNIPFQPEGNTQQLQEFDKVFIQLYNEDISLTAGDVVLKNKPSEFLRFNKNVQGGHLESNYKVLKNSEATTSASISVAKGKFASILIEALEGVLGPYRLRGPNNEKFIIVLANSEKVYVDGQLMQRGYNYDYTIDYNRGEITFTNRIVITKFSRIRVDFEYSDRNYSRTIFSGSHYQKVGKLNVFSNFYSEKDNRNKPLSFDLGNDEKLFLSSLGDNLDAAVISGADSTEFNPDQVLYKKVDTTGEAIFVYSSNPDSAFYDVVFSDVGIGNGHYIERKPSTANGKVYEWIAPVNGMPQGNYSPIIAIPTPTKKQMFTGGANYQVSKYGQVFSEIAISENDVNLYSGLDSEDNKGEAFKAGYQSEGQAIPFIEGYKLSMGADYEFNDKNFQPIDRFRFIEFDRNWNYVPAEEEEKFDDHIINASVGIEKNSDNLLRYRIARRNRGTLVDGVQQYVTVAKKINRFQFRGDLFMLDTEQKDFYSNWKKADFGTSYISRIFVPGYTYSREINEIYANETDSIISELPGLPSPLNYEAHTFYLRSNDSLATQFNLNYSLREDLSPQSGELVESNKSRTTNFSMDTQIKENHDLSVLFTYRVLENFNVNDDPTPELEETIMGKIDWVASFLDNHINSDFSYAASNGRELKREFVYLKVPTGEGTHTWRDENDDVVKDLNEFYEAINPDERNYAKIFTPTDEYILAFTNTFNYSLNFDMPRNWRNAGGLKGFLSRFSNSTSWSIDKKHTDDNISARFISFEEVEEEQLLSIRESFRTNLFFNRSNPKFGMDGGVVLNERKELLTNGFESRKKESYLLNARYNIQKLYNIRLSGEKGQLSNASDFLTGRNYRIDSYRVTPELEWQPLDNFRFTASYSYIEKKNVFNTGENNESSQIDEFGMEARITQVSKSTLNATIKYSKIDFQGDENTALGYELLQALRPGDNLTWSLNLQQRIVSGLQLSLNYEGRKSAEMDIIHTGRMQISALF